MEERADLIGGHMAVISRAGEGTEIRLSVPVPSITPSIR
jgi:signal transduction histidine kinase